MKQLAGDTERMQKKERPVYAQTFTGCCFLAMHEDDLSNLFAQTGGRHGCRICNRWEALYPVDMLVYYS